MWITCGCFYQLFGQSFWRHPFTAEDPLVSKWWNATFLQIWLRNKLIYIWDGLKLIIFSANFQFCLHYSFSTYLMGKVTVLYTVMPLLPLMCFKSCLLMFLIKREFMALSNVTFLREVEPKSVVVTWSALKKHCMWRLGAVSVMMAGGGSVLYIYASNADSTKEPLLSVWTGQMPIMSVFESQTYWNKNIQRQEGRIRNTIHSSLDMRDWICCS